MTELDLKRQIAYYEARHEYAKQLLNEVSLTLMLKPVDHNTSTILAAIAAFLEQDRSDDGDTDAVATS